MIAPTTRAGFPIDPTQYHDDYVSCTRLIVDLPETQCATRALGQELNLGGSLLSMGLGAGIGSAFDGTSSGLASGVASSAIANLITPRPTPQPPCIAAGPSHYSMSACANACSTATTTCRRRLLHADHRAPSRIPTAPPPTIPAVFCPSVFLAHLSTISQGGTMSFILLPIYDDPNSATSLKLPSISLTSWPSDLAPLKNPLPARLNMAPP